VSEVLVVRKNTYEIIKRELPIKDVADFLIKTRANYRKALRAIDDEKVKHALRTEYVNATYNVLKWVEKNYTVGERAYLLFALTH